MYHIDGYAFANIPMSAGNHDIECTAWRPVGGMKDRLWCKCVLYMFRISFILIAFFMGVNPKLKNIDSIYNTNDRYRLHTESMGKIHLELTVLARGFEEQGIVL